MAVSIQLRTPVEVRKAVADRVRALRLARDLKQSTLASKAGISVPTLQRFERTGSTSFENLLRIAQALGRLDEFDALLLPARAESIAELAATTPPRTKRLRGRR